MSFLDFYFFIFLTQHRWLGAGQSDEGTRVLTQGRRETKDKASSISPLGYLPQDNVFSRYSIKIETFNQYMQQDKEKRKEKVEAKIL